MGMIGGWELLLIFFIVLLVFGARRLPEIAKSLGKSVHEFKKAKDDILNYSEEDEKQKEKAKDTSSYEKSTSESPEEKK
ncbi:MAG: hypothetical protein A2020_11220 [Lentisphaerae bacterium GWF2_45_14]|nr:MAG: hypothetical protein A2020_11220 [Lentisphaerae bacterium GWF2_45_14]